MKISELLQEDNIDEGFWKNAAMAGTVAAGLLGGGAAHAGDHPIGINSPNSVFSKSGGVGPISSLPKANLPDSPLAQDAQQHIKGPILAWYNSIDPNKAQMVRSKLGLPTDWIMKQKADRPGSSMTDKQLADSWWMEAKAMASR